jgi:uncharacterized PurR-regulated membrane protein YhhQ (DUF165 family)
VVSGVIFIAIVKPLLDIINELYGAQETRKTVIYMSIVRTLVFIGVWGVALIPAFKEPAGFNTILQGSIWLFLFGVVAELIASLAIDIPIFTWLKENTKQGFLVRQYLSNVSLVIQSLVFSGLYVLLMPQVPFFKVLVGQIFALVVISSVLAPFAALVVRKLRK